MEKTSTRDEVASKLKDKEDEINRHLEALQDEVARTGADIKAYIQANPWIPLAGSIAAGILVGLVLGRRNTKDKPRSFVDEYYSRLESIARQAGASEKEIDALLKEAAFRDTMASEPSTSSGKKTSGMGGKLFGIAANMAIGFAKKAVINAIEDRLAPKVPSDYGEKADV